MATVKLVAAFVAALTLFSLVGNGVVNGVRAGDMGCPTDVTVQEGDTLASIATVTGTTVNQLVEWNDSIGDPNLIHPGDRYCVTPPHGHTQVAAGTVPVPTSRQAANHCTGGNSPGTVALRDAMAEHWPNQGDAYVLGIYNCRDEQGGSSHSTHAEGRAVDWKFWECTAELEAIADELAANYAALGIQRIITCEREWRVGRGWFVPSEALLAMHNGTHPRGYPIHLHIEQTREAAAALTHDAARLVFNPPPPPEPVPDVVPEPEPQPEPVETQPEPTVEPSPEFTPPVLVEPDTGPDPIERGAVFPLDAQPLNGGGSEW